MYKKILLSLITVLAVVSGAQAAGNEWNESFNKAKMMLERQVYYDHRVTLYCGAVFDEKKNVTLLQNIKPKGNVRKTNDELSL